MDRLGGVGLALIGAVFGFAFFPTISGIVTRWLRFDEAYSHGFLVLAISLFLVQRNLKAIWPLRLDPQFAPLILVFGCSLIWAIAGALHIQVVQEVILPVALWLMLLSVYGWHQARSLSMPVGFLYFAIPFWDFLAFPLQLLTVAVSDVFLALLGITAVIEDTFITLPGIGVFEVANGCSGLRYLVVGTTLATLFGYLNYSSNRNRLMLVAIAVGLSLLANWIRVVWIIYAGYTTQMQSPLIKDHEFFGWLVFAATLLPLFWIAHYISRNEREPEHQANSHVGKSVPGVPIKALFTAGLLAVTILPGVVINPRHQIDTNSYAPIELPNTLTDWRAIHIPISGSWSPEYKGFTQKAEVQYFRDDRRTVSVNVYLYSRQSSGQELIQESNRLFDPLHWRLLSTGTEGGDDKARFNEFVLEHKQLGERYIIIQDYYVAGLAMKDQIAAKLAQALGYLKGRHDASMFTVSARCNENCLQEREMLHQFVESHHADILSAIDRAYLTTVGGI